MGDRSPRLYYFSLLTNHLTSFHLCHRLLPRASSLASSGYTDSRFRSTCSDPCSWAMSRAKTQDSRGWRWQVRALGPGVTAQEPDDHHTRLPRLLLHLLSHAAYHQRHKRGAEAGALEDAGYCGKYDEDPQCVLGQAVCPVRFLR